MAISLSKITLIPRQSVRNKALPSLSITIPPPSLSLATVISPSNIIPMAKGSSTPALIDDTTSLSISPTLYSASPTVCSLSGSGSATSTTVMPTKVSFSTVPDQPTVSWSSPLKRATTEKSFVKRPGGLVRTRSQRLRTLSANFNFGNLLERPSSQRPPSQNFTSGVRMRRVSGFMARNSQVKSPTTPSPPFSPTDEAETAGDPFAMNGESYTIPSALSDPTSNVYDISAFTLRGCSPTSERKTSRSIKSSKSRTKRMNSKVNIYDLSVHDACTFPPRDIGARRERANEMKARRKARVITEKRRSKRTSNPSGLPLGGKQTSAASPLISPAETTEPSSSLRPDALHRQSSGRSSVKQGRQTAVYSATDVRLLHDRHTSGVLATSLFTPSSQRRSQSGRLSLLVPSDIALVLDAGSAPSELRSPRISRASRPFDKEDVGEGLDQAYHRFTTTGTRLGGVRPLSLPKPAFTTQSNVRSVLTASSRPNIRPISYPSPRYQSELSSNAADVIIYPDFVKSAELSAQGLQSPVPKICTSWGQQFGREFTPLVLPDFGELLMSRRESGSASGSDISFGVSCEDTKGEEFEGVSEEMEVRRDRAAVFEKGVWPKLVGGY